LEVHNTEKNQNKTFYWNFKMFRNCLNSVEKLAEKEVDDLKKSNKTFSKYRYSKLKKWLILTSALPLSHIFKLFLEIYLLSFSLYLLRDFDWLICCVPLYHWEMRDAP
jgi:hypothetical protein|tara:strand:+ start:207 stop:530 length:324 start_codon:yes stop_codon:yes gene_type:complete